ncbi:MAG: mycofactocin glycosyltransferase [Solirubrobacteraceae bacterium]|nr:mycofactocin glycosyltransferase [Solirubrobacteraceae bacterium]
MHPEPTLRAVQRPTVDVVVPFRGSPESLQRVRERLAAIRLRAGDSVLVVDNTPRREGIDGPGVDDGAVPVLHAAERATPAFARNRGVARGTAEWLVFCDADTEPRPDLLDRYFDPQPKPHTGLIAGGVLDEVVPPDAPAVARYAYLRGYMGQEDTFSFGEWGYPKTANVACRRAAFEAVGGFREYIRAAEDADLTYRLRAAGWEVERREEAAVVHASRKTLRGFIVQKALWGAGGAWVHSTYPGAVPLVGRPGLIWWAVRTTVGGLLTAARRRDRDAAILALFRPLDALAWELGRLLPNERPVPDSSIWKRLHLYR